MKKGLSIALFLAFAIAAGCGGSKHIQRENDLLSVEEPSGLPGLRYYQALGNAFSGRLNLLYERKLKGSADSPVLAIGDLLVFKSTRDRVLLIEQSSGEQMARVKRRRGIVLNPVVIDSFLISVRQSTFGEIEVINLFTGKTISRRVINEIRSGPIIVLNRLVFGTTDGLLTLNVPDLGTEWRLDFDHMVIAAPIFDGNAVYYTAANDRIGAVGPDNGDLIWEAQLSADVVSDLSAGSHVYTGLSDGRFVALDKKTGEIAWEKPLGFQIHGGVAESAAGVFVGCTDGAVYCFSPATGAIIWRYATGGIITAPPAVYDRAVLIGSHDRYFYSIDSETGELIDRHKLEGPVRYGATVTENRIFVTCRKERLYCFEG